MFCLSVFSVFDFSASRVVSSEFLVRKEKGLYFLDAFSFCFYPFLKPSPQRTFLTRIQQWSTNALIHCVSSRSCSAGGVAGGLTLCWQPTKPPARMAGATKNVGVAGGLTLCWQPTKPPAGMLALQRT